MKRLCIVDTLADLQTLAKGVNRPAALRYGSMRSLPAEAPPAPVPLAPRNEKLASIFAGLAAPGVGGGVPTSGAGTRKAWNALNSD